MTFQLDYNQMNTKRCEINWLLLFSWFSLKDCEERSLLSSGWLCGGKQIRNLGIVIC